MESVLTWEHKTLVDELTQGMEKAKQLRYHMCSTTLSNEQDMLLQKILSSYQRALWILNGGGQLTQPQQVAPALTVLEPPISVNCYPAGSEELNSKSCGHHLHGTPKKRKLQQSWRKQVKVNSENGLDGPTDEYSWRKYGQKDILGAKFPRSYYRCSHRPLQNCQAIKQVQRSDDDTSVFEIIYKGTHTCNQTTTNAALSHPEVQETTKSQNNQMQQNQTLLNLKANLSVSTCELERTEMPAMFSFPSLLGCPQTENYCFSTSGLLHENIQGNCSPCFKSQATSDSNYFSTPAHHMNNYKEALNMQHSENDIADIVSANASMAISLEDGLEFPTDPVYPDPNFPFNIPRFFA